LTIKELYITTIMFFYHDLTCSWSASITNRYKLFDTFSTICLPFMGNNA